MTCARTACAAELKAKHYAIYNEPSTGQPRLYCMYCGSRIIAANQQYDSIILEFEIRTTDQPSLTPG